jgi:DUF971 family protein
MEHLTPIKLDLDKARGLTVTWVDGSTSFYPIDYLRKMSPSAEMRVLREQQESNPLAVLPDKVARHEGPLRAVDAELVGHYAIRIRFSDGHGTGLYSWEYLRQIMPRGRDER